MDEILDGGVAEPAADEAGEARALVRRLARGFVPAPRDAAAPQSARVAAPARLHFGFLDLNFDLGRRFVGLGMAIDAPVTQLVLTRAAEPGLAVAGPDAGRAGEHLGRLVAAHGVRGGLRLSIESAIPPHAGLGSGTQLALAVAAAFAALERPGVDAATLARELGRAERSGIGLAAFSTGGVALDGGRGPATEVPPILARLPFPAEWRVLLIFDAAHAGLSGVAEQAAFAALPPGAEAVSEMLCRLIIVRGLPALAERDFAGFAATVGELQRRVGDHFAPAQGGRFASPAVAAVLDWLAADGWAGIGQTSWGPTGFCLVPDAAAAERLAEAARARFAGEPRLSFAVVRGRNAGGRIAVR